MSLPEPQLDYSFRNAAVPIRAGVSNFNNPNIIPPGWNLNGLFFDTWLRLYHNGSNTITSHPVETGANITDHNFINPNTFSFEIGMSDCVTSIIPGQFPALPTRSINAFKVIQDLKNARQFVTLTTKYGQFDNILIESIEASDDYTTQNAMKATINLRQIIVADVQFVQLTGNVQATGTTKRGQVSSQPLPGSLEAINQDLKDLQTSDGLRNGIVNFLRRL